MYGKVILTVICFIAFTAIIGCAGVSYKNNTLLGKEFEPAAFAIPTLADLDVASKKVIGQAIGHEFNKDRLKNEAVSDALKQTLPSLTEADVLVAANFFYEASDGILKVTVIGYPAKYKNFRSADNSDLPVLRHDDNNSIMKVIVADKQSGSSPKNLMNNSNTPVSYNDIAQRNIDTVQTITEDSTDEVSVDEESEGE